MFLFILFCIFLVYCLINKQNLIEVQEEKENQVNEYYKNSLPAEFNMYYVNWCPHCQTAKPEFKNLMNKSSGKFNGSPIKFNMIDCEKNPDIAEKEGVEGYPTFILKNNGQSDNYQGERTLNGFESFLNEQLG